VTRDHVCRGGGVSKDVGSPAITLNFLWLQTAVLLLRIFVFIVRVPRQPFTVCEVEAISISALER